MSDTLPDGWASATLDGLVNSQKGKKPDSLRHDDTKGFVPYLDIHAIERREVRQFADVASSRLACETDLLVVWDGARSGWVGTGANGAVGSTIMALTSRGVEPLYLRHFIAGQFDAINSNTRGTGIPHVDPEFFWNLEIPLAPLAEQRRIVAKLETLLGKVDACQRRLAKIPRLLKRFRQSVLAAACSGRLTADWREEGTADNADDADEKPSPSAPSAKSAVQNPLREDAAQLLARIRDKRLALAQTKREKAQIEEVFDEVNLRADEGDLGEIPETWIHCRIGAIGTVSNGSTPSRTQPEFWDGEIPWVSSGQVRNNVITETRERITNVGYESTSVRVLPRGTVLLAMIGEGKTRGQTALLNIEATINQNIAAVVLEHGLISSEYLWRWFQLQYEATRERGSGSGPQALNCQRVRELPFVLPPLPEQHEIVRRVEQLFTFADQLEARFAKAQANVDKLTPSLLAKAFRGELVPQDPNDEPASALLARIRGNGASAKPRRTAANR